jgi:hypothetical protein
MVAWSTWGGRATAEAWLLLITPIKKVIYFVYNRPRANLPTIRSKLWQMNGFIHAHIKEPSQGYIKILWNNQIRTQ